MSIKNNIGIDNLKNQIKELFNLEQIEKGDMTYLSSARSISLLKKCLKSINNIKKGLEENLPIDMIEIDLREIWNTLGEIIGEVYTEELLNHIFKNFCLGK